MQFCLNEAVKSFQLSWATCIFNEASQKNVYISFTDLSLAISTTVIEWIHVEFHK